MKSLFDNWKIGSNPSPFEDGDVDLWRVSLDRDQIPLWSLFGLLSDDEWCRANKFVLARDREHFIVCRGALRRILAGYLSLEPKRIGFSSNRFGKPFLSENNGLRFNVTHSNGLALIAVARNREVGVDIELIDDQIDVISAARSSFPPAEVSTLKALPRRLQTGVFLTGWTRKEAYLKALGDGFSSTPEQQSAISLKGGDADVTVQTSNGPGTVHFLVRSLSFDQNYKAALAVEGMIGSVRHCQFFDR